VSLLLFYIPSNGVVELTLVNLDFFP
jgi:hypothetical protein